MSLYSDSVIVVLFERLLYITWFPWQHHGGFVVHVHNGICLEIGSCPRRVMMCPSYSTSVSLNVIWKAVVSVLYPWYAQSLQGDAQGVLEETEYKRTSIYTDTKRSLSSGFTPLNTSCISRWITKGALVKPNSITINSYKCWDGGFSLCLQVHL